MNNLKYLNKIVTIKIDRPMSSKHPKHGFIYPVNYGMFLILLVVMVKN